MFCSNGKSTTRQKKVGFQDGLTSGLQKNTHWEVYMQQYGLAEEGIGIPAGEFARPGHKGSRVKMVHGDDTGRQANALRPCGDDWIMGIITDQGNVCAKVTRLGEIVTWKIIESEVPGLHESFMLNKLPIFLA